MQRWLILLIVFLFLARGSTYAQSDSMYIEIGGIARGYLVSEIYGMTFRLDTTSTGIEDLNKVNEILNSFTLRQNYPNPFNPTTNISYHLPERGNVQVRIYDVNGKETRALQAGMQESGEHQVTWDSRNNEGMNVSSGVYFYQVQFNNSILTKKMIYLK